MKFIKRVLLALFLSITSASGLWAAEAVSPELVAKGRDLFNKKEGLKVKFACILCHQKDKAIKQSELAKAGDKLPAVINKYLTTKSKGVPLAEDSEEMKALMAYIRTEHAK